MTMGLHQLMTPPLYGSRSLTFMTHFLISLNVVQSHGVTVRYFLSPKALFKLTVISDTSTAKYANTMPNPDRILADGEPFYTSFIDYFGDDVSGNESKSWNKHWNIYFSHRNLPHHMLQQEYHVHFLSTSPFTSVSEQYSTLKEQIECVFGTKF